MLQVIAPVKNLFRIFYHTVTSYFYPPAPPSVEKIPPVTVIPKQVTDKSQTSKIIQYLPKSLPEKQKIPVYHQGVLKDKIVAFLDLAKKGVQLGPGGYCNGFTFLWLYKMSEGQESWFYNLTKKIVDCPDHQLLAMEMDIEKLINHIEWAQNPMTYTRDPKDKTKSFVQQRELHKVLEVKKIYNNKKPLSYTMQKLRKLFNDKVNDGVITAIGREYRHVIGIVQRGFAFYLYDPNYSSGRAKRFSRDDFAGLFAEIKRILYPEFAGNPNELEIQLEVDIARITEQKSQRLIEKRSQVASSPLLRTR